MIFYQGYMLFLFYLLIRSLLFVEKFKYRKSMTSPYYFTSNTHEHLGIKLSSYHERVILNLRALFHLSQNEVFLDVKERWRW